MTNMLLVTVPSQHRKKHECQTYTVDSEPQIDVSEHWFTVTFPCTEAQVGIGQAEFESQVTGEVAGEVTGEVAGEVAGEVRQLLSILANGPLSRTDAQAALGLKGQANLKSMSARPTQLTENRKNRSTRLFRNLTCQICKSDSSALQRARREFDRMQGVYFAIGR